MRACPGCGEVVSDQVAVCRVCGYEFSDLENCAEVLSASEKREALGKDW